ncbi:MAG: hypothetical protein WC099_02120 [Candidatus Paceibacterota bacterium]
MFFLKRNKIFKILLVLCVVATLFFVGQGVQAETDPPATGSGNSANIGADVMSITVPVVGVVAKGILYILNILVGMFISLAGFLLGWALQFNLSILTFEPSFMKVGWTIFRDIANLGFVLGIIIIAVATILRYKNYTAKQILWKLIVAALIVNFSLVIGGVFVTISNTVSSYLLNAMSSGGGAGAIAQIGDSFGFIKIVTDVSSWSALGTLANAIGFGDGASMSMIVSLAVILVFGIIFLFTLLGLAGMFVLRYFNLVFLLMISPVVWLLWIFPSTSSYFKQWWTKFLHWVQFVPIMLVFLYIALSVLSQWSTYQASVEGSLGAGYVLVDKNLHFGTLMVAIVACALLIGGLKIAQAMGAGGTKMALGAFEKSQKWAKKRAQRTGAALGSRAMNTKELKIPFVKKPVITLNKSFKEKVQEKGSTKWGKAFGIGALSRSATLADDKLKKTAYGDVDDIKKKYGNLSPKELQNVMNTFTGGKVGGFTGGNEAQAAFYELLSEKDGLGEGLHDVDHLSSALDILSRRGKEKTAGDIQKKLSLNGAAIEHLKNLKKNPGNIRERDLALAEMGRVYTAMSDDDFKSYMKNAGTNIMTQKDGFLGISGDNGRVITGHLRGTFLEDSKGEPSMVSAISASVKNKYDDKDGSLKGDDNVTKINAELIGRQLEWFGDEVNKFNSDLQAYKNTQGQPNSKYNEKEYLKRKARLDGLMHEQETFQREFDQLTTSEIDPLTGTRGYKANTGADFSDLVDTMKNTNTSSYSDLRNAMKAIKIV